MLHQDRPFEGEACLLETGSGLARIHMTCTAAVVAPIVHPSKGISTERDALVEKGSGGRGGEHGRGGQLAQRVALVSSLLARVVADAGALKVQTKTEAAWSALADRSWSLVHLSTETR